ncbi:uncharacterized protein BJ212DRAFT_1295674 [Suillus subaureus]|uniref:Uncharacterized protein n=1 Tax=Suillus subaureus TaxID=48587 RepID=A0A9P7JI59_9AGAM|nr:uncharacterized protein BJ212DRAFT_1295674 [Suillus subaureus]KAG1824529.1 hypothetical protein BJ212DRAFT_1295674 [Suillus subaureus]
MVLIWMFLSTLQAHNKTCPSDTVTTTDDRSKNVPAIQLKQFDWGGAHKDKEKLKWKGKGKEKKEEDIKSNDQNEGMVKHPPPLHLTKLLTFPNNTFYLVSNIEFQWLFHMKKIDCASVGHKQILFVQQEKG